MFLTNLELGKKIKILREFKCISRIDFATKLNHELKLTSSDPNYLSENKIHKYESGKRNISAIFLLACARVLNINIRLFFEDIERIISKDSNDLLFDSKTELIMRLKISNLVKVLNRLSDDKVYNRFFELLENLEKQNGK